MILDCLCCLFPARGLRGGHEARESLCEEFKPRPERRSPLLQPRHDASCGSFVLSHQLSPSKQKPKKRKRREREAQPEQLPPPLEERLESYMDKMATWQLMQTVDSSLDRTQGTRPSNGKGKEKEKEQDGRDWMQAFCEDVVEPLYVFHVPHP